MTVDSKNNHQLEPDIAGITHASLSLVHYHLAVKAAKSGLR